MRKQPHPILRPASAHECNITALCTNVLAESRRVLGQLLSSIQNHLRGGLPYVEQVSQSVHVPVQASSVTLQSQVCAGGPL